MKIKIPEIKLLKTTNYLKILYTLFFLLILAVLAFLGMFLYKNFYQTLIQSEEIILLRQEVSPDSIDIKKVNEVLDKLEKKVNNQKEINWEKINNPFITSEVEQETAPEITVAPEPEEDIQPEPAAVE